MMSVGFCPTLSWTNSQPGQITCAWNRDFMDLINTWDHVIPPTDYSLFLPGPACAASCSLVLGSRKRHKAEWQSSFFFFFFFLKQHKLRGSKMSEVRHDGASNSLVTGGHTWLRGETWLSFSKACSLSLTCTRLRTKTVHFFLQFFAIAQLIRFLCAAEDVDDDDAEYMIIPWTKKQNNTTHPDFVPLAELEEKTKRLMLKTLFCGFLTSYHFRQTEVDKRA